MSNSNGNRNGINMLFNDFSSSSIVNKTKLILTFNTKCKGKKCYSSNLYILFYLELDGKFAVMKGCDIFFFLV